MAEWTIGAVLDAIAEAVPDRLMTICEDRRSTFAETAERTCRLSNFLAGRGFGVHCERDALDRWECGQDRVALIMHNDLYADSQRRYAEQLIGADRQHPCQDRQGL